MIKHSTNYCKSNNNFIIEGITTKKEKVKYIQTIKIVKNIINRGCPTIMSKFLKKNYTYDIMQDNENYSLISREDISWRNTIKGKENTLDNPALIFYENIIDDYLGEYAFVKKLILPEAPINEIIKEPKVEFKDLTVDFYIPQINKVIEIDGIQHKYTKYEDRLRDELHSEKVIRINTKDIRNRTEKLKDIMTELKDELKKSKIIEQYKFQFENNYENKEKMELIQIIRLEMTVLELLKAGILNFENTWNIKIIGTSEKIAKLAFEDLLKWFKMIFALQKIKIQLPNYILNQKASDVVIDIDIFKRYDDSCCDKNIIYVRTDYYENESKNYYKVECDENYKYDLDYKNVEDKKNLTEIMQNIFGHEEFREKQDEIIMNVLNLNDTIGILPTGSGKSLCYQVSALLQPAISIIICPLKSLIKDQKDNMTKIYLTNVQKIDSTMNGKDKSRILKNIESAKYQMIWVSPERFQSEDFRDVLSNINKNFSTSYAVIDEVHCMSEWGHNFRTSYLMLVKTIKKYMPASTLIGLTATASDRVLKDLKIEFEINNDSNIITTLNFIRKELSFRVYNCKEEEKVWYLFEIIKKLQEKRKVLSSKGNETNSGLIFSPFAGGNRGCIELCNRIALQYPEYKNNVGYFVGKQKYQSDIQKEIVQDEFKTNKKTLLVATKSFGMGIDKGNIRYIIHFGIPSSIESLYQEVGRAGRDKKPSICYIIHALPEYDSEHERQILFNTNSTVNEIKKDLSFNRKNSYGRGDIFDQMELFITDKDENEIINIYNTYMKYIHSKSKFEIKLRNEEELGTIEKDIYKLSLLGIVTDWTVTYNPGYSIKGTCKALNEKQIKTNIENYINKYEYGRFCFENLDEKKYKSIIEILNENTDNFILKYIKIISAYYHENILYSRRRSIEQVDSFISSLENDKDCTNEFNKTILNYFRTEDYNLILKYIGELEEDYIPALMILYDSDKKINIERLNRINSSLDRILVTNRLNTILILLDGITKLFLNKEDNIHYEDFEYAIEKISNLGNRDDVYKEILYLASNMQDIAKNKLNEILLKYFNSIEDLICNYQILKTKNVLNKIIEAENKKIIKLERNVINGFRKNE